MAGFEVITEEDRDLESKFTDAATHAIHSGIVLPRVAEIKDQTVDEPDFNLQLLLRVNHLGVSTLGRRLTICRMKRVG